MVRKAEGHWFLDFGRAAFAYLEIEIEGGHGNHSVEFRFGEKAVGEAVDMKPGGSIRAGSSALTLADVARRYRVPLPQFQRPAAAVPMPDSIGEVMPFRYVEILNCPARLTSRQVTQVMIHCPFDDDAAAFRSSDPVLNDVWELCRYSIKATSFAGIYVDGDRERIPYEADAYINQLGQYCTDHDFALARRSHEYLLEHPTWPTEWKHHSIFIAWYDYLYTGMPDLLRRHYEVLKTKTLEERAGAEGLLRSNPAQIQRDDIVDWPPVERDGYVRTSVNTVVNAFYCRSLVLMSRIAGVIGREDDEERYLRQSERARAAFNEILFDPARGIYVDGVGTDHASLHASMFPLAFGLVPPEHTRSVIEFVKSRGMACSVYGAQYLLDALFESGEADRALALMTSRSERSWWNMIAQGSTITLEAWSPKYKPNLDWNHAWGAAPANIIPRRVLGVRPLQPGFSKALIQPRIGALAFACGRVPTIRGPIELEVSRTASAVRLHLRTPADVTARVELQDRGVLFTRVTVDGRPWQVQTDRGSVVIDPLPGGAHQIRATR